MCILLVCLLSLPLVYFFGYNTFQPKKLINEKKINHQNDVACFRKILINKMSDCEDCQKDIEPIRDGLLIAAVASMTVGIFYVLRMAGIGQHNTLLTSTSLACFMSLPAWKM